MPIPRFVARSNKYLANRVIGPVARFMPGLGVIHHVGRTSGHAYSNPVNVFRSNGEYIISLTYGSDSDWVKNVLAAGGCELVTRGQRVQLTDPRLKHDEANTWAPAPVRVVLGVINVDKHMRLRE